VLVRDVLFADPDIPFSHSTGRGGFANITESHEPDVERPSAAHTAAFRSSGRGGAGNIHT
jgi:hypothetical protein